MASISQLPYLIQLLDDESPQIRQTVLKELSSFGPDLEEEISRLQPPLGISQINLLSPILSPYRREGLKKNWLSFQKLSHPKARLEKALSLLAEFQYGSYYPQKLSSLLDNLATEFEALYGKGEALTLSNFLFQVKKMGGNKDDYYNPLNGNLIYVMEQGLGIPISLTCVYILVAHRLNLDVEGCNFPGHFLALVSSEKKTYLIDCFHHGKIIRDKDIMPIGREVALSLQEIIYTPATDLDILRRVLRNLTWAYTQKGDEANSRFMFELTEMLRLPKTGI